jgi:ABC-type Zn2+ transport system substrate-binding protein/surface adhesin
VFRCGNSFDDDADDDDYDEDDDEDDHDDKDDDHDDDDDDDDDKAHGTIRTGPPSWSRGELAVGGSVW